ncbi:hypothetical protein HPT25_18725 [Bacillus sp. BRMEA1]|uniref:hypothetical protein n=1 Tax=Neobacillus endophyticus TaxID=2738405 RepID=UPI0015643952|nr:hypothetical protein [Neobacillus endophyticus]NRD79400.1 hypothetical protein [Neobacillus endophyticus]
MSLKLALFEIKEVLRNQQIGASEEEFIHELETKNNLKAGSLVWYFNHLMMMNVYGEELSEQAHESSKKINRKWTKNEIDFMFHYINDRQQEEWGINITEILDEIAKLLNRGYQSVNYKYYTIIKSKDEKQNESFEGVQFTTINQKDLPVLSAQIIADIPAQTQVNQTIAAPKDDDLLDILSGLITNVQKLPGLNLNELLRSLYQLTNMALQNQHASQEIESMKSKVNSEKLALQDSLVKKEQQLMLEKKRNDELQKEVAKLAMEITSFNQLGDAAKIQNLKSYNQRLNYIIDGFGLVLQVGS